MDERIRGCEVEATSAVTVPKPTIHGEITVSLADEEKSVSPFIAQNLAEHLALSDPKLRERVTKKILRTFLQANLCMLGALLVVFLADIALLATGFQAAGDRLIDSGVIKVLIGATVVEAGALMVILDRTLKGVPDGTPDGR